MKQYASTVAGKQKLIHNFFIAKKVAELTICCSIFVNHDMQICRFRAMIPITFLTGFYVSEVVRRYWDQYMSLPYPDRLALKLVSYIPGKVSKCITYKCQCI